MHALVNSSPVNNQRDLWQRILAAVRAGERCVLLCVVESIGSSPGRAGFKMAVTSGGAMFGSIGGGSMEHKLVELARSLMDQPGQLPFLKRQIHQAGIGQDRSGMICSGEQTVAFYNVQLPALADIVELMERGADGTLVFDHSGFSIAPGTATATSFQRTTETIWVYTEPLNSRPRIAIVGGGHVSLALSRVMNDLGFHVHVFDDRDDLNTLRANAFAHERSIVDFHRITEHIPDDPELFIALVSFGYRTDDVALRLLIRRRYRYLGMLGSAEKVRTMFDAMRADGFTEEDLARVHAPIGLPIHSRTPNEIAVSIAAQIIAVKNAHP